MNFIDIIFPAEFAPRLFVSGLLITVVLLLYFLYRSKNPYKGKSGLPRYAKIKPTKQGDYYSIISFWSTDRTSQDMVIHNINPNAAESKMTILKTNNGFVMRMYDRVGDLMYENNKMTMFELANKFMELRQPIASVHRKPPESKPIKTRTLEFK
jgi:hypothetical protein